MIIGVTGSLATGASTVAVNLQSGLRGHLIDADRIAHGFLCKKSTAYGKIVSIFGREILNKRGSINRSRLAAKAFLRKSSLQKLCGIIHPLAINRIRDNIKRIYKKDRDAFIIIDAPLLIESGFHKECDVIIVVTSSLYLQLERAQIYKRIIPADALQRIRQQLPLFGKKVHLADYIINNEGTLHDLKNRCKKVIEEIRNLNQEKKEMRR